MSEGTQSVRILGVRVSTLSLAQAAGQVLAWAQAGRTRPPRYVCATSVHGLIEAHYDSTFKRVLNEASLVVPDGMPLVWVGRLLGCRAMERVYGPALTELVCRLSAGTDVRHFFYGGAPGVAAALSARMTAAFPAFRVAGFHCPPYRELSGEELETVAERIGSAQADVVWVGLSTPKQERWAHRVREFLTTGVVVTVGAAFDFHTGRLRQAPRWMQASGLEWLFRLRQEPRRLWRRYARNNPRFALLAALQVMGLRRFE